MNKKEIKLRIRTIQIYEWRIAVCGKNFILVRKLPNFEILASFSEFRVYFIKKYGLAWKEWYVFWVAE